nr:glycoside hydrolase family 2 TIM barrel-domain containing protein [uncultured Pedobacter sp.]
MKQSLKSSFLGAILMVLFLNAQAQRKVISLNGTWEVEETDATNIIPQNFTHTVPVPSLIDMAFPKFKEVKKGADSTRYFWYKKTFVLKQNPDHVLLQINKAAYSKKLFVNGKPAYIHQTIFSSYQTDITGLLKPAGQQNEIMLRLGTFDNYPDTAINGNDFEKVKFIPGIFDDVNLILTNGAYIENVQIAPNINQQNIKVVAAINTYSKKGKQTISYQVKEAKTQKLVTQGSFTYTLSGGIDTVAFKATLKNCKLWSPEHPFLYELNISTGSDNAKNRFGMRSFRFDTTAKVALLNNQTYFLRGTNVPVYRFFEDSLRGNLPWNKAWVRTMFTRFKQMHWNIVRFHVGPAPKFWYDLADEMGMLIQDEYAIWGGKGGIKKKITPEHIALEYTSWMKERWNHPSIVIWDGQNETVAKQTGIAINMVRHLDLSNRPWDNGYSAPTSATDPIEAHPYLFYPYHEKDAKEPEEGLLKNLMGKKRIPSNDPNEQDPSPDGKKYNNPIILNEYAWLWVNRDGSATTLSENVYKNFFKDVVTNEQRIEKCARLTAALTEYWRAYRTSAAVMYFAGLSYSRPTAPRGETSDLLQNVEKFEYWPAFTKYVKPAFSPVGLMVDAWEKSYQPNSVITVPVFVINDLNKEWKGELDVELLKDGKVISRQKRLHKVPAFKVDKERFDVSIPSKKGEYKLIARINYNGEAVESIRDISVH